MKDLEYFDRAIPGENRNKLINLKLLPKAVVECTLEDHPEYAYFVAIPDKNCAILVNGKNYPTTGDFLRMLGKELSKTFPAEEENAPESAKTYLPVVFVNEANSSMDIVKIAENSSCFQLLHFLKTHDFLKDEVYYKILSSETETPEFN